MTSDQKFLKAAGIDPEKAENWMEWRTDEVHGTLIGILILSPLIERVWPK